MKLTQIAERQILKARAEGQLDGLKGAGKPLSLTGDESPEAAGFRIMAEAGAVPREVELARAVEAQWQLLRAATGEDERRREMAELSRLQLRLDIEREARRRFLRD